MFESRAFTFAAVTALLSIGLPGSGAVATSGFPWAWGYNNYGQLGNGTQTDSNHPVAVSGLSDVVGMAAGQWFSVGLKSDGTVWQWGQDPASGHSNTVPAQVSGISNVIALAAGVVHALALKSDGTVWAWGVNNLGQLGNGMNSGESSVPVQVSDLSSAVAIAAGALHSVALKSDGTVWAGGDNSYGELGQGTILETGSNVPVQVSNLGNVVAIGAGVYDSFAVKSDGTVWAWGSNENGRLGNGTYSNSSVPVQVSGLTGAVAVTGGGGHSAALKSDGTVWTWGLNSHGQLGNGTNMNSNVPVQASGVNGLGGIVAVVAGNSHTLAYESDGTVWAWGDNTYGELGLYTNTDSNVPVLSYISEFPGRPVAIGSGPAAFHSLGVIAPYVVASPSTSNFGNVFVGKTSTATNVTIYDYGPAVTITDISLGGADPGDFTLSAPQLPVTTPAGNGSAAFTVSVSFAPTAPGARTATLIITDNAFQSPQVVTLTGTGGVQCINSISQSIFTEPASSSSISVGVTAAAGCAWNATASSTDNWIAVTGGASGSGSGVVTVSLQANTQGTPRQGTLSIGALTVNITQYGAQAISASAWTYNINTVAGNGSATYSGDNGPATLAGLIPAGLARDASGNLFITDDAFSTGTRVRKVNTTGTITTIVDISIMQTPVASSVRINSA